LYATVYRQALAANPLPEKLKNVHTNKGAGGGLSSLEILRKKMHGRVEFFAILCGRLLWTIP